MQTVTDAPTKASTYINKLQALTDEQMRDLVKKVQSKELSQTERQHASDTLVAGCLRYARFVVRKMVLYDNEDPLGWGDTGIMTIGILNAAHKFDVNQRTPFMTYAMYWIRCGCYSRFREKSPINTYKTKLGIQISLKMSKYSRQETLSVSEMINKIATELNTTEDRVWEVYVSRNGIVSSGCLYDESDKEDKFIDKLTEAEQIVRIRQIIEKLKPSLSVRHVSILENRILAEKEDVRTLEDLAEEFGLSRERVRQLEVQVRNKISELAKSDTLLNGVE